jgi:hypothetical protein
VAAPVAFYKLATRDDSSIQIVRQCSTFKGWPAKLSGNDQILFLTCTMLLTHLENDAMRFLDSPDSSAECAQGTRCEAARLRAVAKAHNYMAKAKGPIPIELCNSAHIWDVLGEGCCTSCFNSLVVVHGRAQRSA